MRKNYSQEDLEEGVCYVPSHCISILTTPILFPYIKVFHTYVCIIWLRLPEFNCNIVQNKAWNNDCANSPGGHSNFRMWHMEPAFEIPKSTLNYTAGWFVGASMHNHYPQGAIPLLTHALLLLLTVYPVLMFQRCRCHVCFQATLLQHCGCEYGFNRNGEHA